MTEAEKNGPPHASAEPASDHGLAKSAPFSFTGAVSAIRVTAVALVWVVVAYFLVYYALTGGIRRLISAIEVTHVEAFGVKVNIDRRTAKLRDRLNKDSDGDGKGRSPFALNMPLLNAAVRRAQMNEAIIRGSRILWVDDEPENNASVIDLLTQLGVNVVAVTTNEEAMKLINTFKDHASRFDAIVTDGGRPDDMNRSEETKLINCPLQYRAVPNNQIAEKHGITTVDSMNQLIAKGRGIPGGFLLVEAIAKREQERAAAVLDPADWAEFEFYNSQPLYADITAPRIIMYSATNGEISYSPCVRTITRRTDYLFNAIVSLLEESREPEELNPDNGGENSKN